MKKITILLFIFFSLNPFYHAFTTPQSLVLLSPYGNAHKLGHRIGSTHERDLAHSFAYSLGAELHRKQACTAALTHEKTDTLTDHHLISLINQRNASFLFKIFFHDEPAAKPTLSIYFLTYNPLTDKSYRIKNPAHLIPLKRAHCPNIRKTENFAQQLKKFLSTEHFAKKFFTHTPHGIPLTALSGIFCPAIALDIGISHPDQQNIFVKPLAKGIAQLILYENKYRQKNS